MLHEIKICWLNLHFSFKEKRMKFYGAGGKLASNLLKTSVTWIVKWQFKHSSIGKGIYSVYNTCNEKSGILLLNFALFFYYPYRMMIGLCRQHLNLNFQSPSKSGISETSFITENISTLLCCIILYSDAQTQRSK